MSHCMLHMVYNGHERLPDQGHMVWTVDALLLQKGCPWAAVSRKFAKGVGVYQVNSSYHPMNLSVRLRVRLSKTETPFVERAWGLCL